MLGGGAPEVKEEVAGRRGSLTGSAAPPTRLLGAETSRCAEAYTPRPAVIHKVPQAVEILWKSVWRGPMTEIWTSILKQIEGKLDAKELKTWFGPTRQVGFVPDG